MAQNDRIRVGDRVTLYRRGKKNIWCADFWRDGQHQRQSLKTANKKAAIDRATSLAASLVDGSYHSPLAPVTIAETVDAYLESLTTDGRAPKTLTKYRGILDALLEFLRSEHITQMGRFNATHFDRFRRHRRRDHQPKTIYDEGIVVKQFFRWAKRRRIILANVLEEITLSKPRSVPKASPTLAQIDTILTAAPGQLRAMLAVLAFTGMRSGELQRLLPEDVDLANGWLHVVSRPGLETKTRESRKVPIHPRLREILQALPKKKGPWYFTAEPSGKYPEGGHWISGKKLNDRFARLLRRLELPAGREAGFVIHSLRHSFETICVNGAIPQRVVDAWLGHTSDRSMAAIYYHLSDEESQRFMNLVPFGIGASAAVADKE